MRQREPLTAIQAAMLRATVRASMATRKPNFAPLGLIPQSTRAKQTFVPEAVRPRGMFHGKRRAAVVKSEEPEKHTKGSGDELQ